MRLKTAPLIVVVAKRGSDILQPARVATTIERRDNFQNSDIAASHLHLVATDWYSQRMSFK